MVLRALTVSGSRCAISNHTTNVHINVKFRKLAGIDCLKRTESERISIVTVNKCLIFCTVLRNIQHNGCKKNFCLSQLLYRAYGEVVRFWMTHIHILLWRKISSLVSACNGFFSSAHNLHWHCRVLADMAYAKNMPWNRPYKRRSKRKWSWNNVVMIRKAKLTIQCDG